MKESLVALMLACILGSGLAELTDKRSMTLLNRYGFSDGEPSTDSDIKRAIEDFQNFHRLEQTGELDKETMALLHMPRCGLPDVQADGNVRRTKRFVTTPWKWDKFHLTWGILNYTSDITEEEHRDAISSAFEYWSGESALTFEMAADPASADIVISFVSGDHGDGYPFNDVTDQAHAFLPVDLSNPIAGDVHLNDAITWEFDINLLLVFLHELGHSLGLSESQDISSVMYPYYFNNAFSGLTPDDIAGIQALYGVKCGAPPNGTNTENVSIDEGSPGEEYAYTCIRGYTADPVDLLVVCEQNNTAITASWSPGAPNCTTGVKCETLRDGVNTEPVLIDYEWFPGDEYTYICIPGYTADPLELMVVCEQTAIWSLPPPTCTPEMTTPVTTAPTTEMTTLVTTAPTTEMITAPPPNNELVCYNKNSDIRCENGFIHIVSAIWGNTEAEPVCGKLNAEIECELDVIEYMRPLCENKTSCEDFKPDRSLFGGSEKKPCGGRKYLNFTYTCEEETTTTMQPTTTTMQPTTTTMQPTTTTMQPTTMQPTTTTMQPTVQPAMTVCLSEGTFRLIDCGLNNVFICSAFYGRRDNSICESNGANTDSTCFVDAMAFLINDRCGGRKSCYVYAGTSWYGTTCASNPQNYLEVTYACARWHTSANGCSSAWPCIVTHCTGTHFKELS